MRTVVNLEELKENILTLDKYLDSTRDPEYDFALKLVKKGICFVAVKGGKAYKFYPSRFIGYANNNMDSHLNNERKDGRVTNPSISNIMGGKPNPNTVLDKLYIEYCRSLGLKVGAKGSFGVERKYWEV